MAVIAGGAVAGTRATVIGFATSLQGLSTLAGPTLGGFAAPALGVEAAFPVPTAFGAVLVAAILLPGWREPVGPAFVPLRTLASSLMHSAAVRASAAAVLTVGLVGGSIPTLVPLRLGAAGYSASDIGAVFVAAAVIGLVAARLAGRLADRSDVGRMAAGWSVGVSFLVLSLAAPGGPWANVAVLIALLPLLRVGGSLAFALGAEHAPLGAGLAAAYGVALTAWSAGAFLGPLVAGSIADAAGDRSAFLTMGVLAAVLTLAIATFRERAPQGRPIG
jgi:MFS transporter, DHA1 family, solute carrier family 18 (vesicular amine transporter), member 1/2